MEEKHQTLKELPVSERPYEKCEKNGTAMLSDAELLAVILRSGTKDQTAIDLATKVLSIDPFYEGILGICHRRTNTYLTDLHRALAHSLKTRMGRGSIFFA